MNREQRRAAARRARRVAAIGSASMLVASCAYEAPTVAVTSPPHLIG